MKGYCMVCDKEIEVQMCCDGRECGCLGKPVSPPICSDLCYDAIMNDQEKYFPKNQDPRDNPLIGDDSWVHDTDMECR